MQLSVIIVNYNVKYFLQQCLYSVEKAINHIHAEVIVVDNNSTDGSMAYLKPIFSWVKFIENTDNKGFGKANNIALQEATGKYILFLNPDTIVPEDCFEKCINFLEQHTTCGALGIKMVDGKGQFLSESKRAFPSPITSFFKLVGLASLFPKSSLFNKYALGYLDENKNHEVDVLAGAFIMTRKELIDTIHGFDEIFFMYGEDVDLSYRIQQEGYKNYYFAESSIIHFKGESTKRGSLNYVKMFYEAMSLFVTKHYKGNSASLFATTIKVAIWLRALLTLIKSFFTRLSLAIIDCLVIYVCIWVVKKIWIINVRHGAGFQQDIVATITPVYVLIFLIAAALAGMYDNLYKPVKAIAASLVAVVVVLAVYSLLPETLRFSRGVILFGGIVSGIMMILYRWILKKMDFIKETDEVKKMQQTIIVGSENDYINVTNLLQNANLKERVLGRVSIDENTAHTIGNIGNIESIIDTFQIREIIFCVSNISYKQIIEQIQTLPKHISFKFYSSASNSIISSDSKTNTGEILTTEYNYALMQPYQKRMKRFTDIVSSLILLISFPIHLIFIKKGFKAMQNAFNVLIAKNTWVGYAVDNNAIPYLKPAIITHYGFKVQTNYPISNEVLQKMDILYAKEYDWLQDVKFIIENYRGLGE
ncbi:MAG: glycosyltransferase [Chitinophagaceae bacterium]|nr:glycosyltransferase [Chitinophagaceae bacterium]MCW5905453.1 glycosyltransferase [Chitinophagaceae bacterium]